MIIRAPAVMKSIVSIHPVKWATTETLFTAVIYLRLHSALISLAHFFLKSWVGGSDFETNCLLKWNENNYEGGTLFYISPHKKNTLKNITGHRLNSVVWYNCQSWITVYDSYDTGNLKNIFLLVKVMTCAGWFTVTRQC